MRKAFILLSVVLFFASYLPAQDSPAKKKWGHFGLKTGVNVTHFNLEDMDGNSIKDLDSKWRTGFVFGAFVTIPVYRSFSVQPEFLYSSMGGDYTDPSENQTRDRYNYFSVPVLIKFGLCKRLAVFAGPQFDILIQGKEFVNDQRFKVSDGLKDHDILATAGLEFHAFKCLVLGARYMRGFNNIDPRSSEIKFLQEGAQATIGITF